MKIMKDRKKEEKGPATLDKFKQMAGKRGMDAEYCLHATRLVKIKHLVCGLAPWKTQPSAPCDFSHLFRGGK